MKINELFSVEGQVAIVTGANKGLGNMYAWTLAENGAKLFIVDFDKPGLDKAVKEFNDAGYECYGALADVRSEEQVQAAFAECVEKYGTIDILINNAGTERCNKAPEDTSLPEWNKVIDINVTGSFICAREAGKVMLQHKKGKIVNISSISGFVINKGVHGGSYDVSKQAVMGLTRALATEWGKFGINVNAIAPGYFLTDPNKEYFDKYPGFYDEALAMIPIGKMSEPENLAGTMLYLCTKASDYVHGIVVFVDGGYTIW